MPSLKRGIQLFHVALTPSRLRSSGDLLLPLPTPPHTPFSGGNALQAATSPSQNLAPQRCKTSARRISRTTSALPDAALKQIDETEFPHIPSQVCAKLPQWW